MSLIQYKNTGLDKVISRLEQYVKSGDRDRIRKTRIRFTEIILKYISNIHYDLRPYLLGYNTIIEKFNPNLEIFNKYLSENPDGITDVDTSLSELNSILGLYEEKNESYSHLS